MKILSYNVNGIRAAITKGFLEWLQAANPDVICLQEIKAKPIETASNSIFFMFFYFWLLIKQQR